MGTFLTGFCQKCKKVFSSKIKLNFILNYWLDFSSPCLSWRFSICKVLFDFHFVLVSRTETMARGNCRNLQNLNRLDKETHLLKNKLLHIFYHGLSQHFSTCWVIISLESFFASQTLWTKWAKMGKWFFFWKINRPLKNQWLHSVQEGISQLFYTLVKTYENVTSYVWFLATKFWYTENAKICTLVWSVLILKFDSFQNDRL